jgi:sulfopyruvate decarboxylase TPP-binding subunit
MISGSAMVATLAALDVTDVVWLPDSAMGPWERDLESSARLRLHRICREGEAWILAAGLYLGGRQPLVMIQSTGFFESGDALRNALFDLKLPLWALIGYRSYLAEKSADTARHFLEPILQTWGIDYVLLRTPHDLTSMQQHLAACRAVGRPGAVLLAEGKM